MKLPPLTAIRHFTAAASHLSFREAARELCVTEGAISRQIKLLEEYFGCALFLRVHRGVQLSDEGRKLYDVTDQALFQIAQVTDEILGGVSNFTLSVTTSFAIRWLMPRLSGFEALHPSIPINLQTVTYPRTAQSRRFDASIVYQLGDPADKTSPVPDNSELIMIEWLLPVCAPGYLSGYQEEALVKNCKTNRENGKHTLLLQDLKDHRVIFNEPTGRDWRSWAIKSGDVELALDRALKFEHDDTAIQVAVAGHGIALANLAYISNELKLGSLVPAVACQVLPIGAHYLVTEKGKAGLSHVETFRDWLMTTAESFKAELATLSLPKQ
ncbi:LysR substrate-binding domain-containing protein [Kiloniella sp. EL199]|uniref:LysR substrate-binding domain-containing protein n=1 Tax=Kiloniella sp. EL199 TaxID=2107581 RepID=UPI000EA2FD11|nr:LysR substrate-binding domain-containing protein [Kiloniella sp. EL199]